MSIEEKIYLAGVLVVFATFIVVLGPLSWLDGRDERIKQRQEKANKHTRDQVDSSAERQSAIKHI